MTPGVVVREKDIEQSHVCLGTPAYPQAHVDRHALYVLNTILGGSMSSRLFQHIREDRGLAYAVFSSLMTYSDAGALTVYAGCAADKVAEVIELTLAEFSALRRTPVPGRRVAAGQGPPQGQPDVEPREHVEPHVAVGPAGDVLSAVSSRSMRCSRGIEAVTADDVQRVAGDLFGKRRRRGDRRWTAAADRALGDAP